MLDRSGNIVNRSIQSATVENNDNAAPLCRFRALPRFAEKVN